MKETNKIIFTACEHLDFSDNYGAKKEAIVVMGETKVYWHRPVVDESFPALVQFCKLRGRLNNPEMCLCEKTRQCSDYKEHKHTVIIKNAE